MSTISFAAIQHSQAQAEQGGPVKDYYYFREIQESLREAAGFLKWRGKEVEEADDGILIYLCPSAPCGPSQSDDEARSEPDEGRGRVHVAGLGRG